MNASEGSVRPDVMLMNDNVFRFYEASLTPQVRYRSDEMTGNIGFSNLQFREAPCFFDQYCPAGYTYMINTDTLFMNYAEGALFSMTPVSDQAFQDAFSVKIILQGQMVTTGRKFNNISPGDRQRRWKLEQRRSSCRSNCRTIVVGTSEVARTTDRKGLLILSKELPPLRAGIFLFLLMPLRQCVMAAIQMRRRVRNLYRSLVERTADRAKVIPEITRHRLTVETPSAAGTSKSLRAPLPIKITIC